MLPFRQFALFLTIAIVLIPAPVLAQGAIPGNGANIFELSHELLGRVLRNKYGKELVTPKDAVSPRHYTLALKYNPPKSKEILDWTVTCEVVERAGQCPMTRVWFNCKVLPADTDAGRLRALLDWSGGHGVSRAFFKSGPHKSGPMLSLVVEVPPEDVTEERFTRVIDALLLMAYETTYLWGGNLSTPLDNVGAKAAAKPAVAPKDLIGNWAGKVFMDGKEVGQYAATLEADGFTMVTRANTTVANPTMQMLTGKFAVVDGKLTTTLKVVGKEDVEEKNAYDVAMDGDSLSLTATQNKVIMKIQLTRGKTFKKE